CETALAEAEIEYEEDESHAIFVGFAAPLSQPTSFIIWTTTPWTLPSNVAVAVHPEYEYSQVEVNGENYIVASQLLEPASKRMGWTDVKTVKKFKGSELEGIVCRHPFIDRDSKVVLDRFVTLETGTGCVHIAPGHGDEDYKVGLKYKLPIIMPVDEKGRFTDEVPQFAGISVWKANQPIIDLLKEKGALLGSETLKHPYPHCWRCKKPVIFRATEQWFIAVDHDSLRDRVLEHIKKIKWIPGWGENRIRGMVESRPDWCISRQRSWGIPIPAFYCKTCGTPNFKGRFNQAAVELTNKLGSDAWFEKSPEEILPKDIQCEKCAGKEFTKETDIMDVWLESGSSHYAVLKDSKELSWPADLYLEGSDQHRGWFQTSILTSIAGFNAPAFKSVLTHGFTIDEKGKKMSKSLGNVVDPQKVVDEYGADVLRLWVASTDFRNDMAVSKNILKQINEGFKKIRNTCRFLLSNMAGFVEKTDKVDYEQLTELDKYALLRLLQVIKRVEKAYEDFEFHIVYHALYDYCVNDLSTFYLDIVKDRLYCDEKDSLRRRSTQSVLNEILTSMIAMMAPVLSFTAQDLLQSTGQKSVLELEFPKIDEAHLDAKLEERWEKILEIRAKAYKEIEELRSQKHVSQTLQCDIIIKGSAKDLEPLKSVESELTDIFLVSCVTLMEDDKFSISAVPTRNKKCERCWRFVENVKENTVCARCADAVK
ncbi:MAG: isoleucine--tRNA ligase, partial [Candidatus Margulisiibacteriota bacterium]